ncbi:enoyl-CoA hydratase-related protein [Nocardioides sp. Kera G14]|uniref:enoyl-CoA hydratase-related protein n=1 Tax=Nocardioides sp. Kera G14 TaxID=2884264 RepID=UPI001D11BC5E|nr:enoyl-CoA hydratase-related protein [Nocardioides sp. Kera G14]UDY23082.1 enoyl-CoA hydratase/isomerase family protein [Nocardioides sp. Kera G14]
MTDLSGSPEVAEVTDELLIERADGVVTVTFNAPARMNAFSFAMYQGLHDLCDSLAADESVKVLVLRGAGGRAFAAGNQISDFLSRDAVEYEGWLQALFAKIQRLPQVSIAVIDGVCVGGGLAVATHCDLRLATPSSRFGYPIGRTLGNALSSGVLYRCAAIFGEALTREMLLAARLVGADRAYAVGALAYVGPAVEEEVASIIASVQVMSGVTIGHTKTQLARLVDQFEGAPEDEDAALREIYTGPDFNEGVRAFLAKEKPAFPSRG